MNYQLVTKGEDSYIEITDQNPVISTRDDIMDIIALSFENETGLILLPGSVLSDDFFYLKTGLAGEMLQKMVNYHIKVAAIIDPEKELRERFKELASELNKGNDFRIFYSKSDGENWLLNN